MDDKEQTYSSDVNMFPLSCMSIGVFRVFLEFETASLPELRILVCVAVLKDSHLLKDKSPQKLLLLCG